MYYVSLAQIARAMDRKREGLPKEPHLQRELAALPWIKSPLEVEVEQLRSELKVLRAKDYHDDFVVNGFDVRSGS